MDRSGRARDAGVAAGAAAVGSAARARPSRACRPRSWAGWDAPLDRFVAAYLARPQGRRAGSRRRRAVRAARVSRRLGPAAGAGGAAGVPGRSRARQARARSSPTLLADNREVRGPLDLVLERPAAQRGRRDLFLRDRGAQEHHRLAATARSRPTCRTTSSSRSCSTRRRRAIPRGFSIGVNWRGETSAAVTPWMQASQNTAQVFLGDQPEVQRVPRQLRQQVEAEGRVRAGGLLRAGAEAAAVSVRCRAGQVRRAGISLSRAGPRAGVELARRSPRRRGGHLHRPAHRPAAAHAGQPHLAPAVRPRYRRATRTKWTACRGARSCSTGSRAISCEHRYDVKRLIADDPDVARLSDAVGRADGRASDARLCVRRSRGPPADRRAVRRRHRRASPGEWNVYPGRPARPGPRRRPGAAAAVAAADGGRLRPRMADGVEQPDARARPSDPRSGASRCVPSHASTLQALELVNGEIFTQRLSRGARRMLGELPPEPVSLYNRAVAGRTAASSAFDIDVSKATQALAGRAGERIERAGGRAAGVGAGGARRSGRASVRSRR